MPTWNEILQDQEIQLARIQHFLDMERDRNIVLPRQELIFSALKATPFDNVKVVILGQDPYPTPGHAHGMAFSILPGKPIARGAHNIIREYCDDLGFPKPNNFYLMHWAEQGVLLLNTILTVRSGAPMSHAHVGWQPFTTAIINAISRARDHVVFILWGKSAWEKIPLIDTRKHHIINTMHPSPHTAHKGFFGSRPFTRTNDWLISKGRMPVDWRIPDL